MWGSAASDIETTSLRGLSRLWIYSTYTDYWWLQYNVSRGGSASWNALARLDTQDVGSSPRLLMIEFANDNTIWDRYNNSRDAWIRRAWTKYPLSNLVVIIWPIVNPDGTLPADHPYHVAYKALCTYYGVPYIDVHSQIKALVDGGEPITTYYNYPAD